MCPRLNPMNEWSLQLSETMRHKINNDSFMHITIVGERNNGKTYYALKNMALTHYCLNGNNDEIESFNYALGHTIFTVQRFKEIIKENRTNKTKIPFILLDDAGSHFDSGLYHRDPILYQILNTCLDTIKDVTNCLIITCPFKETLTMRLRYYDGYDITTYMNRGYERYCTCIKWYRRPTGERRWTKRFEDSFSCYIPNEIHYPYLEMRNKFTLSHLDYMDELDKRYQEKQLKE